MERRENNKKRGREGEATTKTINNNAKKRELMSSSCLYDSVEAEQSNDHPPKVVCEYNDGNVSEVGVFDFPWLKDGATSKGYYDCECRLEFEDLFADCWSGAYNTSSSAPTCLDFSDHDLDLGLDHQFFQQNLPSDDRLSRTTTRSDDDRGRQLPILHEKNVEELDGIWSSVLDQPLDDTSFNL